MATKRAPRTSGATPIYIIAGFLGSGKTTLLKRALAYELDRGVKPAVLMNEFGEVDVDGAALCEHPRAKDIELQAMLSGCICCDLSGEFSEKVEHLIGKSKGAPLFIETTGLADTGQVVMGVENAVAAPSAQNVRGTLASVIVMVDAPRFLKLGTYWAAAEQHLHHADLIVLNKLDQVDAAQANAIERRIKSANPGARIRRALHADVDVEALLAGHAVIRTRTVTNGAVKNSADGYQSGSFKILRPIDSGRLHAWLRRYQRTVVRLKGFINVDGCTGLQNVQWIMGSLAITPYRGPKQAHAKIVVIGRRVSWERFLSGLERCLVRPKRQGKRWSQTKRSRA